MSTEKNALVAGYLNLHFSRQLGIVNKVMGQELTEMLALSKVCFRLHSPKQNRTAGRRLILKPFGGLGRRRCSAR